MITDELKYLKALQPKIVQVRGWKENDRFFREWHSLYGTIIEKGEQVWIRVRVGNREFWETESLLTPIPPAIDPENPSRGLWGMVGWSRGYTVCVTESGTLWIRSRDGSTVAYTTPYLALLKTLAHQWGVEVEE